MKEKQPIMWHIEDNLALNHGRKEQLNIKRPFENPIKTTKKPADLVFFHLLTNVTTGSLSEQGWMKTTNLISYGGRTALIDRYFLYTKEALPNKALKQNRNWPISNDHCFQRVVLDNVFGGAWYDFVPAPAYQHLTERHLQKAVALCEAILDGSADIFALNRASLHWRKKQLTLDV